MRKPEELECLRLAARQWGVITREQAQGLGVSERQVTRYLERGWWERLHYGVYRVGGSPLSWRQRLKAVSLWAGYGYALSHHTAGALLGFARCGEGPVELSVIHDVRLPPPVVVHRVAALVPKDLTSVEGFRVTSVSRTLLDLSATWDEWALRSTVDQALARRWTTVERLEATVLRCTHHPGVRRLRALVEEFLGGQAPTESELESLVARLLREAGFSSVLRQRVVSVRGRVRRMDFLLAGTRVVIEADGYAYHSSPAAFERDRARRNALMRKGFWVVHWTWAALRDRPEELIAELKDIIKAARLDSPAAQCA
jgi:very-short-patch-repair endonuclease